MTSLCLPSVHLTVVLPLVPSTMPSTTFFSIPSSLCSQCMSADCFKRACCRNVSHLCRRLPVPGNGSCRDLSLSVAHSSLMFQVPSDSIFPPQLSSSSRALPLHLHFDNCSDVFGFISFDVPEPFPPSHTHRYRFHLCFRVSPFLQCSYVDPR